MDELKLVKPGQDLTLFDKRLETEHEAERRQREFAGKFQVGAPEMPDAQIVFSTSKGTFGVAVKGARFVCDLPRGYERQGLEIGLIDGGLFVVTFPGKPALVIDPHAGTVRRM